MSIENKKNFIVNFVYYGIIFALVIVALKFGIAWLSPFVVAFLVAFMLKPLINKINVYCKLKRGFAAILCVAMFYVAALLLISLAGFQIFLFVKNLFYFLPDFYTNEVEPSFISIMENIQHWLIGIDPGLEYIIDDFIVQISDNIGNSISSVSMSALTWLSTVITKVPSFFVKALVAVIASFFISIDYYEITYFIAKQLTLRQRQLLYEVEVYAKTAVFKYLKSYSLIMLITFCELSGGFLLLGVKRGWLVALIISVFDILPVLGTGGILVPWGIISILTGKTPLGVGIIVLYFIITVVRNTIEPKIIGKQVGLHPVATLLAMFIGTKTLGILGLFLFPVSLAIIKQLNDAGKIKIFK